MAALRDDLSAVVGAAFAAEGLDPAFGVVRRSDRPDLSQFQTNGALAAAKAAKANPRAIAEAVAARLGRDPRFAEVSLAGPGFINLTLGEAELTARLREALADPRLGLPDSERGRRIVIDFGGPNVAKLMHVGHLRSSVIGDSLQRLFRFLGAEVSSDVHLGDWGTQMGQILMELRCRHPDWVYFDAAVTGPYPAAAPVAVEDLQSVYPVASAACKEDPARMAEARAATAELQAGRPGYRALWRHFVEVSVAALKREFASLGVAFDWWKGESDADPLIPGIVADLKARGLAQESDGAWIVPVAEPGDRKELPPFLLLKSDGAALYETTDLATILDRVRSADPDLILYVVDQRQRDHFEKVFRAARKAGYAGRAALEHVGFGTVNGPDGRPFKTRAGDAITLYDLIRMATDEAEARLAEAGLGGELPPAERECAARAIGIGALKFADLMNNRVSDYVFDLAKFTRFEGKTGPYLQYAGVRVKSLLRKAAESEVEPGPVSLAAPAERALALELLLLPDALAAAAERRAPNLLCDAAFSLAQAFSRFYTEHHILSETDPGLRAGRLALAAGTLRALSLLLDLLGIEIPERM